MLYLWCIIIPKSIENTNIDQEVFENRDWLIIICKDANIFLLVYISIFGRFFIIKHDLIRKLSLRIFGENIKNIDNWILE